MPQGHETRLARLAAGRAQTGSAEAARRRGLRAQVAVCALVRQGLIEAGIDPAGVAALRLGDLAAAELAGLGEAAELRHAGEAAAGEPGIGEPGIGEPGIGAEAFAAKMLALTERRRGRGVPDPGESEPAALDLAGSSLAELLAWCLLRPV